MENNFWNGDGAAVAIDRDQFFFYFSWKQTNIRDTNIHNENNISSVHLLDLITGLFMEEAENETRHNNHP